jgi:hypothetical protein
MTDLSKLSIGLKGAAQVRVGEEQTAPRVGSGAFAFWPHP